MTVETQSAGGSSQRGPVRIAFIVMAHQRPEAVIRLVRRLDAPDHGFFIHYDLRRSDLDFQRLAGEFAGQSNVKFLKRHKCRWGDAGILHGMIEGIHELARMNFAYDYAIHISGQDYPIKSNAQIRERLAAAAGASFMEATAWPIPNWEKGRAIKRMENFHVHLPVPPWARSLGWQPMWQHLAIPMKRQIPGGLHPYFGSAFWYFHRACQQQIHEHVTRHPDFLRFFDHVLLPEECFFQTLLMNSKQAPSLVCHTLTHIEWRPPWPGIMTLADLPKLQQSDCLFARKFAPDVDRQILDQLDLVNPAG